MTKLLKEIRDLLKEILAELKQQKEPTAITVDSWKLVKAIKDGSLEYHDPAFTLNRK